MFSRFPVHDRVLPCVTSVFARGRFMQTQQSTVDRENVGQRGRVHERARGTRTGLSAAGARPAQVRGVHLSLECEGAPHPHSRAPGGTLTRARRGVCTRGRPDRSNTDQGLAHLCLECNPWNGCFVAIGGPVVGGDQTTVSGPLASPPGGGTVDPFLSLLLGALRHARGGASRLCVLMRVRVYLRCLSSGCRLGDAQSPDSSPWRRPLLRALSTHKLRPGGEGLDITYYVYTR